jgi:predicted hotdog family 3-hydroxylacyl-ACP dehydratase
MTTIKGEGIKRLIPQRYPIIMLDMFCGATETEANTGLTVTGENLFCSEGFFCEPGLIEHIAQSASALAGYQATERNEPIPTGFIGEIKKCRIYFLPRIGDELHTHIRIVSEVLDVSLIEAETKVNEEVAMQCRMKIYIKPS